MRDNEIKQVFWEITDQCTSNCVHCSFTTNKCIDVSDTNRIEILEKLISSEIKDITITGGEPTLVDLQSILKIQDLSNVFLRVCTNGLNLDEELLEFFNANGVGYNFSFHSLTTIGQKAIYGSEVPWVNKRVKMLLNKGKKELFALNTILLKTNYDEIIDIARYLNLTPDNIRKWRILNPINSGRMKKHNDLYIAPEDVDKLREKLDDLRLNYLVLLNSRDRENKPCRIEEREEVYVTKNGYLRPCLGLTTFETDKSLLAYPIDELLSEDVMSFWTNCFDCSNSCKTICKVNNFIDPKQLDKGCAKYDL